MKQKEQKSQKSNLIWLGDVVNTHGLKGELKVLTNSSFIKQRFSKGKKLYYLDDNNQYQELISAGFRMNNAVVLVTFTGVKDINDVQYLKGKKLFVVKDDIDNAKDFVHLNDLITFEVFEDKTKIGVVERYWNNSKYWNIDVKKVDGTTIVIPLLKNFLKKIDYNNKCIGINLPDGYLQND